MSGFRAIEAMDHVLKLIRRSPALCSCLQRGQNLPKHSEQPPESMQQRRVKCCEAFERTERILRSIAGGMAVIFLIFLIFLSLSSMGAMLFPSQLLYSLHTAGQEVFEYQGMHRAAPVRSTGTVQTKGHQNTVSRWERPLTVPLEWQPPISSLSRRYFHRRFKPADGGRGIRVNHSELSNSHQPQT